MLSELKKRGVSQPHRLKPCGIQHFYTTNTWKEKLVQRDIQMSSEGLRIGYSYCSGFHTKNTELLSKLSSNPFQSQMEAAGHSGWQSAEQTEAAVAAAAAGQASSCLTCRGRKCPPSHNLPTSGSHLLPSQSQKKVDLPHLNNLFQLLPILN